MNLVPSESSIFSSLVFSKSTSFFFFRVASLLYFVRCIPLFHDLIRLCFCPTTSFMVLSMSFMDIFRLSSIGHRFIISYSVLFTILFQKRRLYLLSSYFSNFHYFFVFFFHLLLIFFIFIWFIRFFYDLIIFCFCFTTYSWSYLYVPWIYFLHLFLILSTICFSTPYFASFMNLFHKLRLYISFYFF